MVLLDCEAILGSSDEVRIAKYQDGHEAIADLHGYRSFMADKCFADCDPKTRETNDIKPPIQRPPCPQFPVLARNVV